MDHHDTVARLCTAAYLERLPGRGSKPTTRSNGVLEWTVLAGFVISYPDIEGARQYSLVSLATGQKSIPYARAAEAHGDLIHDCHAEVLARRGARHWLSTRLQAERTLPTDNSIRLFEAVDATRSRLRKGIELHLYVSTLPCGDASSLLFEFQRAKQDVDAGREEAVTPLALLDLHSGAAIRTIATSSALSRGRAGAQRASRHLRTKPGRPDSPPSISMSCSDKLALWSAVGIQGSLLSSVIEAVHINSVTISDGALISIGLEGSDAERLQGILRAECIRSLNRAITNRNPVEVAFTTIQFLDSKESVEARASIGTGIASAFGSVLYTANPMLDMSKDVVENLVAGTKLGASTKRATQSPFLLKPAARSAVCKLSWWTHVSSVLPVSPTTTYWDAKRSLSDGTQRYRAHKQCLIGARSSEQSVNAVNDFLANTNTSTTAAPQTNTEAAQKEFKSSAPVFEGWLVTPPFIEHFKRDGSRV